MSNETKRDVFVNLAKEAKDDAILDSERMETSDEAEKEYKENIHNYDAALPDDIPVIPKAVGEYIRRLKSSDDRGLIDIFWCLGDNISAMGITGLYDWEHWMFNNQETVAHAWLLDIWRVEETGKIVKLEEEK